MGGFFNFIIKQGGRYKKALSFGEGWERLRSCIL